MNDPTTSPRLCDMTTLWSVVRRAHDGPAEARVEAGQRLLERYRRPVHRYFLGALRDEDAAAELSQEFALRLLRGDFRRADPGCGRFRDYVKTSLFRMADRYRRRSLSAPRPLPADLADPSSPASGQHLSEEALVRVWREGLLVGAWEGLAEIQQRTGSPVYLVLRARVENADLSYAELTEHLSARLGKPLNADAARQAVHRAREKFAELLLDAVIQGLDNPTTEAIEQDLLELNLLEYCRPILKRAGGG